MIIICILMTTDLYGLLTTAYFRSPPHLANVLGHRLDCIHEIAKRCEVSTAGKINFLIIWTTAS
jgi:hypothetical protein